MYTRILSISILALLTACGSTTGSGNGLSLTSNNVNTVASQASASILYANIAKGMAGANGAYGVQGGVVKNGASGGYEPTVATEYACPTSGNIVLDVTADATTGNYSIGYNACTATSGTQTLVMDGSASGSWTSTTWSMTMPSLTFSVSDGTQSFDMSMTNYTASADSSSNSLDFGVTIDSTALAGAFTIETIDTLTYGGYGYPTAGTIRITGSNGSADITYYSGGYTVTFSGATIDCLGYVCPS